MTIDDRAMAEVLEASQDIHSEGIRTAKAVLPQLEEIREERRGKGVNLAEIHRYNQGRRNLLRTLGLGGGNVAGKAALGGLGGVVAALIATPANADEALDIQILQTASSLEVLAVATYDAALGLPFIKGGNKVVKAFAETTMKQHDEHRAAFQAQTEKLGGTKQTAPNPKFVPVVEGAKPGLKDALAVASLAETLETIATQTYLENIGLLDDTETVTLMGSVMGVETQHAATLRAVKALLMGGAPELIALDASVAAKLPAAAGSVAFPLAFEPTENAADPSTGALS